MKQVICKGSTVIPTSSSLETIQVLWAFFPENRDQSVEVSAEINGSLIFGILGLFSGGKIQHLTIVTTEHSCLRLSALADSA